MSAHTSLIATISSKTNLKFPERNAPRSITISISLAPFSIASFVSANFTFIDARPDGNAVATAATGISFPPIKSSSFRAIATKSLYTQTAPTCGTDKSFGSGLTALAQRVLIFPGVSAPSKVVKSTMLIAISIAQSLLEVFIERVASIAARACAPT